MENSLAIPQRLQHRISIQSSNSTPEYISTRTESKDLNRYLYTNIHSGIIHSSQKIKTTQYQSTGKCINKMWYTHTIEYYLTIKINRILHATTWMNLENILSENKTQNTI